MIAAAIWFVGICIVIGCANIASAIRARGD
jgi:hypothetical protein